GQLVHGVAVVGHQVLQGYTVLDGYFHSGSPPGGWGLLAPPWIWVGSYLEFNSKLVKKLDQCRRLVNGILVLAAGGPRRGPGGGMIFALATADPGGTLWPAAVRAAGRSTGKQWDDHGRRLSGLFVDILGGRCGLGDDPQPAPQPRDPAENSSHRSGSVRGPGFRGNHHRRNFPQVRGVGGIHLQSVRRQAFDFSGAVRTLPYRPGSADCRDGPAAPLAKRHGRGCDSLPYRDRVQLVPG